MKRKRERERERARERVPTDGTTWRQLASTIRLLGICRGGSQHKGKHGKEKEGTKWAPISFLLSPCLWSVLGLGIPTSITNKRERFY